MPTVLSPDQIAAAAARVAGGETQRAIAASLGVAPETLSRALSRHRPAGEADLGEAPAGVVQSLRIADIEIAEDRRKPSPDKLAIIKASIFEIGLQTPIQVRVNPAAKSSLPLASSGPLPSRWPPPPWLLVVGAHRLAAMRELGHGRIPAVVVELDELDRELWEIDENLARAELGPAARARDTARRKEIYETKHPDARAHVAGGKARAGTRAAADELSFARDTARRTGKSPRTVQRDAARGQAIAPEVLAEIDGTAADTGATLDRVARAATTDAQRAAIAPPVATPAAPATPAPARPPRRRAERKIKPLSHDPEKIDLFKGSTFYPISAVWRGDQDSAFPLALTLYDWPTRRYGEYALLRPSRRLVDAAQWDALIAVKRAAEAPDAGELAAALARADAVLGRH